ncbi:hypothetical protein KIW84_057581 [Lathyrus oleraceus]|uniref:Uncharacterized protein n=1 Tax=Pisum sativum TaxID=3888 RepID=A0A9D5AN38_PEA|nr:hypothetical protein KIW84_057581 [Pisum sativum]
MDGNSPSEGLNYDIEGLNYNQLEVDRVNVSHAEVKVKVYGTDDSALHVNFKDSENDLGIDGEIIVDDEEVSTKGKANGKANGKENVKAKGKTKGKAKGNMAGSNEGIGLLDVVNEDEVLKPNLRGLSDIEEPMLNVEYYRRASEYDYEDLYEACYSPVIYLVNEEALWTKSDVVDLQSPPIKRQSGRPKKKRNKEA